MDLNEEDLGSDTDDDDYVPDGDNHAVSEEEGSGEDEGTEAAATVPKKKKPKSTPKVQTGRVSMFEENEDKIDWSADQKRERKELDEAVAKKKTEDIWADFKKDAGAVRAPKPRVGGPDSVMMTGTSATKPTELTAKPKSRFGSIFDNVESSSEKKEANTEKVLKPKNRFGSLFDAPSKNEAIKEEEKGPAGIQDGKVEITKVFDFAGEKVTVSKQVSADSKEATKFLSSSSTAPAGAKRPGGLAGVVGGMAKKTKMGCLDKSKLDWNGFVAEQGIREELSTHNKGKEGYVEKLEFLERADHRQFEQEKAIRDKTRKSLMK